jgi:hypothetical protein
VNLLGGGQGSHGLNNAKQWVQNGPLAPLKPACFALLESSD